VDIGGVTEYMSQYGSLSVGLSTHYIGILTNVRSTRSL
jgi:hypothetical protein